MANPFMFRFLCRMYYKRLFFLALFVILAVVLFRQINHAKKLPQYRPKVKNHQSEDPIIELDADQRGADDIADADDEYGKYHHLDKIGDSMSHRSKCPACYGQDLCKEFFDGVLTIDTAHPSLNGQQILYSGFRHGSYQVTVKTHTESVYRNFDRFLCKNASLKENCDVAVAAVNSFITRQEAFSVSNLRNAYKIFQTSTNALP